MTAIYDLILYDCTTNLVSGPLAICWISDDVITANENCNWHLSDVLKGDKFCCTLVLQRIGLVELGSPLLEAVHLDVLSEEQQRTHRGPRWVVRSVDHIAVLIVPIGVTCHRLLTFEETVVLVIVAPGVVLDIPPPFFVSHDFVDIVKRKVIVYFFVVFRRIGQVSCRSMFK